jgi:hypothetical protein
MNNVNARSAKLHKQLKPGTQNFGISIRTAPTTPTADFGGFNGLVENSTKSISHFVPPERHLEAMDG